ncbi:tRNA pseudouridine(13) synthase TruD [Zobellella maritima]|uniref:tRNA pseudouridine(13) synthase TruD n=1 Tax=Zobellella maritima TaxID=2059725 RepID=UPI000E3094E8|nr:tRNA pseudouridine(13) synthase TruD [Zobellella maritima]
MMNNWQYLHGEPAFSGRLKVEPEDFVVEEDLGFEPCGEGEHILLHIRKRGQNTQWVARELARLAGVAQRDITWAGLKDRHAVTQQWFGVHLPGKAMPDFSPLENDDIQILAVGRHHKKLRVGALKGNFFRLRIRELAGSGDLDGRLAAIAKSGVPNYFGTQRFGFNGGNLEQARAMFGGKRIKDRNKRSLYLSAARSYLFNQAVSHRLSRQLAFQLLPGDCVMLEGSQSFFTLEEPDDTLLSRFAEGDIRLSAPLWGRGRLPATAAAAELELAAVADHAELCEGLEANGLKQERRALLLQPQQLSWQQDGDQLELTFWLPAGSYATSVMRELITDSGQHEETAE